MKKFAFAFLSPALVLGLASDGPSRAAAQAVSGGQVAATVSPESHNAVIREYCVVCHSDTLKTGDLTLESFDVAHADQNADVAEKVIRKLQAGMMPPNYAPQPEAGTREALARSLAALIDEAAAASPNPGGRTFQRLNRVEYAHSIRDLLALDVDVAAFLPPDTVSASFDNIADVQTMSATLMEGYLRAARTISELAVGDPRADPAEKAYTVPRTASQMEHIHGAPLGTRGGLSIVHNFSADGQYIFKLQLHRTPEGMLFGLTAGDTEQIEVSINGERVALLDIDPLMSEMDADGLVLQTDPVTVKTGPQRVSAAFIQRFEGPGDDLIAPIEHTLADGTIGRAFGMTSLPHLAFFSINGPYNVTGVSDTPSRRKIFTCRPTSAAEERSCATEIVSRLASQAFRRPVDKPNLEGLMSFYQVGVDEGDFETGIRVALQAILASPLFVFRIEQRPDVADPSGIYRVSDLELASRLSYFLWASAPDDELVSLASQGELRDPAALETQVERMLADPRSESLATRFASQWLRLHDLPGLHPDALLYPQYDQKLAEGLKRETELFFDNLVREDRSVLELLTADYTFVNERVAKHYRIPNVTGHRFRRVELEGESRRGLLGHGSILTLTSVANRTSPVQRGKWVLEVLLGSPPPPPPPNVPELEETEAATGGKLLSVRERMEEHRSNPACQSCHDVIDPIGLALENFDVTGAWRIKDNGVAIDATGELYDGTEMDGPEGLRQALLNRSDTFIMSFTESLMIYALGRRVEYYDMPALRAIISDAAQNGNRISSFIVGVVNSAAFQMKKSENTEGITEVGESDLR